MPKSSYVYEPIQAYQTRIICLHGDDGDEDSALVCDLYIADILHPLLGRIGLRGLSSANDKMVEYEALSYVWGDSERTNSIDCNGSSLAITKSLFAALEALRNKGTKQRYLWADGICINQSDNHDKDMQIPNMFMVYHCAQRVIAWLGPQQNDVAHAVDTAYSLYHEGVAKSDMDVISVLHGLRHLYSSIWFQRVWVQQEIYGAREIQLRWGSTQFEWLPLFSQPDKLFELPELQSAVSRLVNTRDHWWEIHKVKLSDEMVVTKDELLQIDLMFDIQKRYLPMVDTFKRFYLGKRRLNEPAKAIPDQLDLVSTILDTGALQATDGRDRVYALLGITGFPARAMTIEDWRTFRQQEIFIPVDSSATIASLSSAVTWAILMKAGLGMLAKFKVFTISDDETPDDLLPSWTIDWRLASTLFIRTRELSQKAPELYFNRLLNAVRKIQGSLCDEHAEIQNAWSRVVSENLGRRAGRRTYLKPWHVPLKQTQFVHDNQSSTFACKQLILRGFVDTRFYVKERAIYLKRDVSHLMRDLGRKKSPFTDRAIWKTCFTVLPTDLIVHMTSFVGPSFQGAAHSDLSKKDSAGTERFDHGGLWLLRPHSVDEYKLVACLLWFPIDSRPLYGHWWWYPDGPIGSIPTENPTMRYRRLAVDPEEILTKFELDPDDYKSKTQLFTIV